MDKQTNILTNTQDAVPVNTRTIGAPEGIYILYLEDYVHTFIKKLLSNNSQDMLLRDIRKKEEDQEYGTLQQEIALYGRSVEENGRYRIVISGAAVLDGGSERIKQLNNTYFPSCSYIGNASVGLNKDSRLRLELTLRSTKVILDDFYIYYDQNEEMQNYLVEWNASKESDKGKVVLSPTEHDTRARNNVADAARLSRITQAYNREDAKVSFMWNVMNVLCLGFVVCVMAYGIISMNNYNKMQNMQANIDYCMAFIKENTSLLINTAKTDTRQTQPVPAMNETAKQDEPQNNESNIDIIQTLPETQPAIQDSAQSEEALEAATQALAQATVISDSQPMTEQAVQPAQSMTEQAVQPAQPMTEQAVQPTQPMTEQAATPQYYVVRKGDTLRTICYDIYGDYSRVDEICKWNNIEDPNNILYGQKLLLP